MTDYDPNQPQNLHSLLGAVVNAYWNEYQHYWEIVDGPDDVHDDRTRAIHRALDEMGEALKGAMRTRGSRVVLLLPTRDRSVEET